MPATRKPSNYLKKFVAKHHLAVGTALAFLIVLFTATTFSIWQAYQADVERHNAVQAAAAETEKRKQAEGLLDLLTDTFSSPGAREQGRSVTVFEALSNSIEKINEQHDPKTASVLLFAISTIV